MKSTQVQTDRGSVVVVRKGAVGGDEGNIRQNPSPVWRV